MTNAPALATMKGPGNTGDISMTNNNKGENANPNMDVPQINLNAISRFATDMSYAAQVQNTYDTQGLQQYLGYMQDAKTEINTGFNTASGILSPLSTEGQGAMVQMMNMLGLNSDGSVNSNNGAQISSLLENTPGYQFALNEGALQTERGQAANRMLGSGNTQLQLMQQGQGLADNTFNSYMSQLSGVATLGSQATMQLGANAIQQGQDQSQITSLMANQSYNTAQTQGNNLANAIVNSANMKNQTDMFNAGIVNQRENILLGGAASNQNSANSAQPGIMQAQNASNALNYSVFQNQQGGQAFTNMNMGGGSTNPGLASYQSGSYF